MPQAVHTNADYVPDIYCLSTSTEYNEKEKVLDQSIVDFKQLVEMMVDADLEMIASAPRAARAAAR